MINFLLLLVVFIWGANYSVVKAALHHFSPLAFNGLRFILALLVLLTIVKIRGQKFPRFQKDWKLILFVGLVGHFIYQIIFIYGISWTRAGNASLILASTPIFVALFSHALGHEKVTRKMWIGIFASFFGVSLIVLGSAKSAGLNQGTTRGDLTILLGAVLWSIYIVASAPLVKRYGAVMACAATLVVGAPALLAASIPSLVSQNWRILKPGDWVSLSYSSVLAIAIAQIVWYRAIGELGNTKTSVYSNLIPLVGVFVAWPLLGETPRLLQLVGAAAILAGAFLTGDGDIPEGVPKSSCSS